MDKLYPIIKKTKTSLGRPLEEDSPYSTVLLYCPVCNKRLSAKKLHPAHGMMWCYEELKAKSKNGIVGEPTYCEKCGNLIHPLS